MHRRIKRSVYYGALIIFSIVVAIMVWHANLTGTVIINSVDQNGTMLAAPKKVVAPINTVKHIQATKIEGYTPNSQIINAAFSNSQNEYNVVYQPKENDSFQHLVSSKYIGVSAQDVTTNSKSKIQSTPFESTNNRLRILYGKNSNSLKTLNINYPNTEIQDPSITKFGQYWFITYTGGVLRTADFTSWQEFKFPTSKKYGWMYSPSLIHSPAKKLSMVFTTKKSKNIYQSYVAPFNYIDATPNFKKAQHLRGLDGAESVSIYNGGDKFYAIYTSREKNVGTVYIATSNKITTPFKVVKKIVPPSGTYYYAPTFVLAQDAKAVGITYSSYFYDESNDLSYSKSYYRKGILGKDSSEQISGQFVFQKVSAIQIK